MTDRLTDQDFPPNGADKIPEALGLMKDWITAVIQIETAALTAIGALFLVKDRPGDVLFWQTSGLLIASLAFGLSLVFGVFLLNTLPGASQRIPKAGSDIYSIITKGRWSIYDFTIWFRSLFVLGVLAIMAFIIARICKI